MAAAAKAQKATGQQTAVEQALSHDGVLQHILRFVGAGQHLFLTSISQRFKRQYRLVLSTIYRTEHQQLPTDPTWTVYRAAFESSSRLRMAWQHDISTEFEIEKSVSSLERLAGTHADIATLQVAAQLGLNIASNSVLHGAVASGDLVKVQLLQVPSNTSWHA